MSWVVNVAFLIQDHGEMRAENEFPSPGLGLVSRAGTSEGLSGAPSDCGLSCRALGPDCATRGLFSTLRCPWVDICRPQSPIAGVVAGLALTTRLGLGS